MKRNYFLTIFIALIVSSCSIHIHVAKVKNGYINKIKNKQDYFVTTLLGEFNSNITIFVDSIKNVELKKTLKKAKVEKVTVTYRFDTSRINSSFYGIFNTIQKDSCIRFNKYKKWHFIALDYWRTINTVCIYFGKVKPNMKNEDGEYSDLLRRINDSVYFFRQHVPSGY